MRADEVAVVWSPDRGAGFSGLVTCGSVWLCPVCAAKINARRSAEIGCGLVEWQRQGGSMVMLTLTMRHHAGHRLATELDALATAWRSVNGSKVWRKWLVRLDSPGLIRVVEITHGDNGWHAHLHAVVLVGGHVSAADVVEWSRWLFAKWHRAVLDAGMPGALAIGQDAHLVDGVTAAANLAEYFTKQTSLPAAEAMGRELMGSWSKTARAEHSTRPAHHLVADFLVTGEADLLDAWHEYERATFRRRQVEWSRGLRDRLGVGQEVTDDEIVDDGAGDPAVVFLSRDGWDAVLRLPEPSSRLLVALDEGGAPRLREYLDAHHIDYREP